MAARSYLFVPGDRRDMLDKVAGRGADAVIADLEDAVAPSAKAAARATVADWLTGLATPAFEVWVRVNPGGELAADLDAVCRPGLTGVMVPKVDAADDLVALSDRLTQHETSVGKASGEIRLLPIVETARGLLVADKLAAAPRVERLMIGELDLAADLGIDATDTTALLPLRMHVVVASAAAGLAPPLGPVSRDYRNLDALREETRQLSRLGFGARPAIHPAQVAVYNEVLRPDAAEVEAARRLVDLYDQSLAEGRGAVTDEHGRMVDEAVVKIARRTLARARSAEGGT